MENASLLTWLFWPIVRRLRAWRRLREITGIVYANLLDAMRLRYPALRFLPQPALCHRWCRIAGHQELGPPERLRLALEELGPTFVKMGQMLAGRADVLPPRYLEELALLLDEAPPEPASAIIAVIESELGRPIDELFAEFDRQPIAAASLAQVHRATLPSGRAVAVKVLRPGIRQMVSADLDLVRKLAAFLERHWATARRRELGELVREASLGVMNELDLNLEARNAALLRHNLAGLEFVLIPEVHLEYSTASVFVNDFVDGVRLTDTARLQAESYDLKAIAGKITEAWARMILEDGFFHTDPHTGNILVSGEQIALLDYGQVSYLTHELREGLSDLLISFARQDTRHLAQAVVDMGTVRDYGIIDDLERSLRHVLLRYYGMPLQHIRVGDMLRDVFQTATRYDIRTPSDLTLLAKTLVILDGVTRRLDPQFDMAEALRPGLERLVQRRYGPAALATEAMELVEQARHLLRTAPRNVGAVLDTLGRGDFHIGLEVRRLEAISGKLNEAADHLAVAVVAASALLSLALIRRRR